MRKKLFRNEIDSILSIPVVFHNYYQMNDGVPSRSFCDYESGNNESGVYTNNNDALICNQRAEKALEILNQQFASAGVKFIPPTDTSLVVDDIKGYETLFIWKENWSGIRANNNIDNVLNIYIDFCIGRTNPETGSQECGTISAMTIYPEYVSSTGPPGLAIKHSAFPGINNNSTGIIAHEIGHMFTLRHLYHLPVSKNENDLFAIFPDFKRELVSGTECNSRGDMICDTPGQPLQDVDLTFDLNNCIYHGFGGAYDVTSKTLKIGGSNKTGSYRDDFEEYTNIISHSNFDDYYDFWGTKGIPDSCLISNQEEYSTECTDTLYNFLPIAANFLQWTRVMDNCLNEQDIGFTPEQLVNIRYSIEHDYTACKIDDACNTDYSMRSNIPPSDLFLSGESSCKYPCELEGGCLVTDGKYQTDYNQYECSGNLSLLNENLLPKRFSMKQIYPNPFNPIARLEYELPNNTNLEITVYNISGKFVNSLLNSFQTAGIHSIVWNAEKYPSGIYFINMSTSNYSVTQKMVLIK